MLLCLFTVGLKCWKKRKVRLLSAVGGGWQRERKKKLMPAAKMPPGTQKRLIEASFKGSQALALTAGDNYNISSCSFDANSASVY